MSKLLDEAAAGKPLTTSPRCGSNVHQEHHIVVSRGGRNQMATLGLDLSPPGRKAAPHKAKNRH